MEAKKVQIILGQMQKNLECSICLEMMSNPVSTNCGHQFCRFCLMEFLERKRQVPCPLCKKIITKRSLTERSQLDSIVSSIRQLISAFQMDTGVLFSPPRGSQANILPSTPEPAPRHCDSGRSGKSRGRLQNKPQDNKDNKPQSSSTERNDSKNDLSVKRKGGKRTKDNPVSHSGAVSNDTDELLKCIAEGLHGAMETDDEVLEHGDNESKKEIGTSDNVTTEGACKDFVNKPLLEFIENGSHGAVLSNSEEINENRDTEETLMDTESSAEKECETKKEDKMGDMNKPEADLNNVQVEKIVLSEASEQKEEEVEASGTSSGDCYPLFRTPVEPNKGAVKTDVIKRPRRVCRATDGNYVLAGVNKNDKRTELDDDTEFEYEDKSFVDQTKIQQTYTRKNKMNTAKNKAGAKKVVEWLKNIPSSETNEGDIPEENADRSKVLSRRNSKKTQKVIQEEGIMGQRIKHLAEQVHNNNKELFFNVEDFANSPKQRESLRSVNDVIDVSDIENTEKSVKQDTNGADHFNGKTDERTKTMIDQIDDVEMAVYKGAEPANEKEMLKQNIDTRADLTKKREDLPLVDGIEAKVLPQRKRIFKSRAPVTLNEKGAASSEEKGQAHLNEIPVKSNRKEGINESTVKYDTEMKSGAKEEPGKVSDPFEFVSSQQTPVKPAKGKKNTKNKSKAAKNKKVPVVIPKTTSRINGSSKLKAIPKEAVNETKAAKEGKLSILKTASQIDIDKVSAKLEQAEDYDLLTCTQDAVAEFAVSEERSKAGNCKKKVSFREPIISDFIQEGRIDIIGYRNAKAEQEKEAGKVQIDVTRLGEEAAKIEAKVASGDETYKKQDYHKQETEAVVAEKENHVEESTQKEEMEVDIHNNSDDDESGDWRFDGNSSGTDDLDIDPAPHEYEQPDFEIQSEELRARMSQEMFEKIVLLKSQEPKAVLSPDPSIIGETPLVFSVPKFNKNLSDTRKTSECKRESKTSNMNNLVDRLKMQQVVPETPVIPNSSLEDVSGETESVDAHHRSNTEQIDNGTDNNGTQQCTLERVGESSEETQAPSLEIIENVADTGVNANKELELKHEEKGHTTSSNSSDLKNSESYNLTDSCSQKSDSILLSKSNNQSFQAEAQAFRSDSRKKDSIESNSCDKVPPSINNLLENDKRSRTNVNSRSLSVTTGRKRKKGTTRNRNSSYEDTNTCAVDIDRLAEKEGKLKSVNLEKKSKVSHKKNPKATVEKDAEITQISQISLISVESASQSSCYQKEVETSVSEQDLDKLDKDKVKDISKVSECESLEKISDTGTYSVNIIPDSVVNTNLSKNGILDSVVNTNLSGNVIPDSVVNTNLSEESETNIITSLDIDKVENKDSLDINNKKLDNHEEIHNRQKSKRTFSDEVLSTKSNSQKSTKQRNLSGVLISPEVQRSSSPENIFGNDSEMPLVDSSPFDETLQPVHLSDEELETQVDESAVAIVSVENDVTAQLDYRANTKESFSKTSPNVAKIKKSSHEQQKQSEEICFATPSPQRKRRPSASSRVFSKRQRLSVCMSSDLTLSSGISPHSKMPDPQNASLNHQTKSPANKYMSPKLIVTRNLPLVSQSPNLLPCNGNLLHESPSHSNKLGATSTPLKRAILTPGVSYKYSPLQHKGRANEHAERVGNAHEVEVVDVVVQEESDEENKFGTPTELPDLDNQEVHDIVSSSECIKEERKKCSSPGLIIQDGEKRKRVSPVNEISQTDHSPKQIELSSKSEEAVYEAKQNKDFNESSTGHEEMEALEESKASCDLNLDSSDEENTFENNNGTKTEEENEKNLMHLTDDCLSSPEFNLDSSGEQDVQEQALKEINKFNEIKDNTESIITMKSDTHKHDNHARSAMSVKKKDKCISFEDEMNNQYSTRLDSSPVQPEVILESDVESEGNEVEVLKAVSDSDSEDEVVRRKRVKKAVIDSSSDEDDDDDNSRHMNLTSSSAFSSQSENLPTQERLALEKDLEKMEREMRAVKEQLRKSKKAKIAGDESLPVTVDSDSDDAMIEADDTGDEMELFMSLPPVSPSNSQVVSEKGDNSDKHDDMANTIMNEKGDCDKVESESEMETVPPSLTELTDVEVDKRPVLADIDVNVTRTHTSPGKRKLLGFIATGLSVSQIHEVKKLAAVNDVKYYNRFNSSVSHVIVKADPVDTSLCDRTLKFFQGVAHKCWIVNHLWVEDSRKVGHLLPEDVYEILGDTATGETHAGPRRSRLAKNKLFKDIDFSLIGENTYLSRDSLRELIETCGGRVLDLEAHGKTGKRWFVISCTDMEEEESEEGSLILSQSKKLYRKHQVLTVTREWVLDSITLYKLQQLNDYLVTNVKTAKIPKLT